MRSATTDKYLLADAKKYAQDPFFLLSRTEAIDYYRKALNIPEHLESEDDLSYHHYQIILSIIKGYSLVQLRTQIAIELFNTNKLSYQHAMRLILSFYADVERRSESLTLALSLLQKAAFRDAFENDTEVTPFIMDGFYDQLIGEINQSTLDEDLKKELNQLCEKSKSKKPSKEQIDADLKRLYGFSETLTIEELDLIKIAKFLANPTELHRQLNKLEMALQAVAGERFDPETKMLEGYVEGNPYQHHKLLSNFCKKLIKRNGFDGYTTLNDALSSDNVFLNVLREGGLYKDNAFQGKFHGSFTHLIQWALIILRNEEKPNWLINQPAIIYKWLGNQKNSFRWNDTFEGASLSNSLFNPAHLDGRKVVEFNEYILSPDCPYPVLHQLIAGRAAKGKWNSKTPGRAGVEFHSFKR